MERKDIQKIMLEKLMYFRPPKWNESHTEEKNLFKSFARHMLGSKEVKDALHELYQLGFINRYIKTGETHVSLNIRKKQEIEKFLYENQ
jgi:hypothetical protein